MLDAFLWRKQLGEGGREKGGKGERLEEEKGGRETFIKCTYCISRGNIWELREEDYLN